jgi:eukaryotic-like serine/threonine-protein kinase
VARKSVPASVRRTITVVAREKQNDTPISAIDPLVGAIFDKRFRVEERLAAGGFGAIYRATHVKSGHPIALKVLHPTLASDLGVLARFRREGTALTSLRNPHTITAYEFGQVDKTLFIVLELLAGDSLYEHYSVNGPLEWKRVVNIARQVCESLEEAHAQGIVHRDLKPTNIHLETVDGDPDFVKVLDFGIAKIVRGSDLDTGDITNVGQMIGTLDYMSPEQMVGGQVTGQTDIYTLGIVMYEMIAGTRPFPESSTAGGALAAMLKTIPEPLYLRAPVPRLLDDIVMRCLERETTKRYRSVGQLREELERIAAEGASLNTATTQVGKELLDVDEETAITPPPEKILASLKTPVRPKSVVEWDDDDELAPTSTRRPDGSDDRQQTPTPVALQRPQNRPLPGRYIDTPPVPQVVVAPFSSSPRVRHNTGQVPHSPADAALGVAPTAVQPAVNAKQLAQPPGALSRPPHGVPPGVPWPHSQTPLSGNHGALPSTGVPPGVPWPHSRTPLSGNHGALPSTGVPHAPHGSPQSGPHGAPQSGPHPAPQSGPHPAPQSGPHRASPSGAYGDPFSHDPSSGRIKTPTAPPGPSPGAPYNAPPISQPISTSFETTSQGHAPARAFMTPPPPLGGGFPPTPTPGYIPQTPPPQRPPTAAYDMGRMTASDTMARRIIWIIVLIVAAGLGFLIASQL